jgi:uncharacterized protein (DUF1778 family)
MECCIHNVYNAWMAKMDMKVPRALKRPRSDTAINLRVSRAVRDEIDGAASLLGKTRTDFIIEIARKQAVDVLLDRRLLTLDSARYAAFLKVLDAPAPPNARLKKLVASKSPWEK